MRCSPHAGPSNLRNRPSGSHSGYTHGSVTRQQSLDALPTKAALYFSVSFMLFRLVCIIFHPVDTPEFNYFPNIFQLFLYHELQCNEHTHLLNFFFYRIMSLGERLKSIINQKGWVILQLITYSQIALPRVSGTTDLCGVPMYHQLHIKWVPCYFNLHFFD